MVGTDENVLVLSRKRGTGSKNAMGAPTEWGGSFSMLLAEGLTSLGNAGKGIGVQKAD